MPTIVHHPCQSTATDRDASGLDARTDPVRRTPCSISSRGEPLAGWYHTPADRVAYDHAVLICAPLGYEQLHAHRALRHLADELARRGIPTLRFDWHGTGDSAGHDGEADRCATWITNAQDAAEWLRKQVPGRRISVIGLRLGATLASLAFSGTDLDHCVLWAPVVKGRAYVRELTAIERMGDDTTQGAPNPAAAIEAGGFALSRVSAEELNRINLLEKPAPCPQSLIVSRDDLPPEKRLAEHYQELGCNVEQMLAPGYAGMMAEPHRGELPALAVQQISGWLELRIAVSSQRIIRTDLVSPQPVAPRVIIAHRTENSLPSDPATPISETVLQLSTNPHLTGVLTEPLVVDNSLPTIVLLNSGATQHIGPGRLHVHLARRLAAAGFRCLRLDVCGLGDSITPEISTENVTYTPTAFRDIDLTLRELQRRELGARFVLLGLCSGAYNAFQAAAQISNPALIESVLLNPLTFFWREGMTLETSAVKPLVAQHYYLQAALDPTKWVRFLSGRSQISWLGALRILARKFVRHTRRHKPSDDTEQQPVQAPLGHPLVDDLPADLLKITQAQRLLTMFFAKSDPGYSILMHKAGRVTKRLRHARQLEITLLPDTDHTFSRSAMRDTLIALVTQHFTNRYSATVSGAVAGNTSSRE